jgi:hypothetical protein
MLGTVTTYHIFYGSSYSAASATASTLQYFVQNLAGSPYHNIQTTYYDGSCNRLSNSLSFGGNTYLPTTTTTINNAFVINTIVARLNSGLPINTNAVYTFVFDGTFTFSDANYGTWLVNWCGYHSYFTVVSGGVYYTLKYAVIGDASKRSGVNGCTWRFTTPVAFPNGGNGGLDTVVSIFAHELEEAISDPLLNAWWFSSTGNENADQCSWTIGSLLPGLPYVANVKLGTRYFLIQQNWALRAPSGTSSCALKYP